jgi:hypothetical protein
VSDDELMLVRDMLETLQGRDRPAHDVARTTPQHDGLRVLEQARLEVPSADEDAALRARVVEHFRPRHCRYVVDAGLLDNLLHDASTG